MDFSVIWIGKYQESTKFFNISGSISKYGVEQYNHFVFNSLVHKNYQDYVLDKISYFINQNEKYKYYFYDQYFAYEILKHINIEKNIICINSENILLWLNNKSIVREWIRNIVKTPEFIVLSNKEIQTKYLINIFGGHRRFIAQKMISSGGKQTFLIDKDYPNNLENDLYIVSPYYESSLSINITSIIQQNNFIVFPISLQIIEEENKKLLYKGSDFISINLIPQHIIEKLLQVNKKILNNMRFLEYLGICGIDYLVHNDEVYFLEINPRFQGSSFLINRALEQHQTSLYQMNIDAFYKNDGYNMATDFSEITISYSFKKAASERLIMKKGLVKSYPEVLSTGYYDYFADKYHIMLNDWKDKIKNQGRIIKKILEYYSDIPISKILDCTCGIGIQAISLAQEGFIVTGSDLSQNELDFAIKEAQRRKLDIEFIQADCRFLGNNFKGYFDAVISIDSALPHLLTKENFILAFQSIYDRLNKGGIFLSSYRDYDELLKTKPNMAYPVRFNSEDGIEYTILRKWIWEGVYILSKQYVISDSTSESKLFTNSYKQWAITQKELLELAKETNYSKCYWLLPDDSGFTQPILCLIK